jgi:hypothetical protein
MRKNSSGCPVIGHCDLHPAQTEPVLKGIPKEKIIDGAMLI